MKVSLANAIEKPAQPTDLTQRHLKRHFDYKYASYLEELQLYGVSMRVEQQSQVSLEELTAEEAKLEREIVEIRHLKLSSRLQKERADQMKRHGGRV